MEYEGIMETIAHELTIEYIRANPEILVGSPDEIEDIVDRIGSIFDKFIVSIGKYTDKNRRYPI